MRAHSGWVVVVACAVVALAACGGVDPAPPAAWDFFGVVSAVEFEDPPVEEGGGSDSVYLSGYLSEALTLTFIDGQSVHIPGGTPGDNFCPELAENGNGSQECVVAGGLDGEGLVAWFEVVPVENTPRSRGSGRQIKIWGLESFDGAILTIRGLPFSVRSDATVECQLDDASTIDEALQTERFLVADVSVPDSEVANVWCVYEE